MKDPIGTWSTVTTKRAHAQAFDAFRPAARNVDTMAISGVDRSGQNRNKTPMTFVAVSFMDFMHRDQRWRGAEGNCGTRTKTNSMMHTKDQRTGTRARVSFGHACSISRSRPRCAAEENKANGIDRRSILRSKMGIMNATDSVGITFKELRGALKVPPACSRRSPLAKDGHVVTPLLAQPVNPSSQEKRQLCQIGWTSNR